jgi:hypothetical protein
LNHNNHVALSEKVLNRQEISYSLKRKSSHWNIIMWKAFKDITLRQHKIDTITITNVLYIKKKCTAQFFRTYLKR